MSKPVKFTIQSGKGHTPGEEIWVSPSEMESYKAYSRFDWLIAFPTEDGCEFPGARTEKGTEITLNSGKTFCVKESAEEVKDMLESAQAQPWWGWIWEQRGALLVAIVAVIATAIATAILSYFLS